MPQDGYQQNHELLSLGFSQIDDQHQEIAAAIEDLERAAINGDRVTTIRAFNDLIEASRVHFAHEEALMRQSSYDAQDAHAADHRLLMRLLADRAERFVSGDEAVTHNDLMWFDTWLFRHINTFDRPFVEHLCANLALVDKPGS